MVQVPAAQARVEGARDAERSAVADLERARNNFADLAAEMADLLIRLDSAQAVLSYGAGLPEPAAKPKSN